MASIYYYSNCSSLTTGCFLYDDSGLTTPVSNGYYSDGTNCFTVTGGNGEITSISACTTTTTSTTTTTTTVAYDVLTVRVSNVLFDTCTAGTSNYFVASGQTLTTGTTIYTDTALTTPLTGYIYIVDGNSTPGKTIYNLDNSTGVVGSSTGNSCP